MIVRRILVPIDFSAASMDAAAFAGELAKQLGARIRFVTVLDVGDLRAALKARLHGFRTNADVSRALRRWIHEQRTRLKVPAGVAFTHSIRRGIAETEILRAIHGDRSQLVVMGSNGLARRLPIGSKTAHVLRRSPVPVLVCPFKSA